MQGLDYASSSQAQRDRMTSGTQLLEQSNQRLQQGKALLAETEVMHSAKLHTLTYTCSGGDGQPREREPTLGITSGP